MVPFSIEIEWKDKAVSLVAEQLDNLADEEGFIRFDVRTAQRRAVIFVNIEEQVQFPVIPQEPDSYVEAMQYPEQPGAFSFDETFGKAEVALIGKSIWEHFAAGHFSSATQTLWS